MPPLVPLASMGCDPRLDRVAWCRGFETRYTSVWALFHMYRHFNHTTGRELWPATAPLRFQRMDDGTWHPRSFLDGVWLRDSGADVGHWRQMTLAQVRNRLQRHVLARFAGRYTTWLADDVAPRVCPQCLAMGYQCMFHQLWAVTHCPVHGLPLILGCPSCGVVSNRYALVLGDLHLGECKRCKPTWFTADPGLWMRDADFRRRERELWEPLAVWLWQVSRIARAVDAEGEPFLCRSAIDDPGARARFFWTLAELVPLPKLAIPLTVRPAHLRVVTVRLVPDAQRVSLGETKAVFGSIRRHLLHRWFRAPRDCLARARRGSCVVRRNGVDYLDVCTPSLCNFALTFVIWEAAWRNALRERRRAGQHDEASVHRDIKVLAVQMLSAFYARLPCVDAGEAWRAHQDCSGDQWDLFAYWLWESPADLRYGAPSFLLADGAGQPSRVAVVHRGIEDESRVCSCSRQTKPVCDSRLST